MILLLAVYCSLLLHGATSELEHGSTTGNDDGGNHTWKNTRHMIKDSSYLLERYPMELPPVVSTCRRSVKCVKLEKSTCMGTKLPYTITTLDLIPERVTQDIVEVDKIAPLSIR